MSARPLTIAITALGGQGGGVLANWVRDLGEANGYFAQSTSVPGVAQRTGSTVYYLELFPEAEALGRTPVLSLSPVAGDIDVVVAAELMEAGRAVQRGFVTPERTALIASSHRAYAVAEKIALGDGIADGAKVLEVAEQAARRFVHFDMQALAERSGAVISAALFGALGGAGVLPFPRAAFEAVLGSRGDAADANRRAFALAWERAERGGSEPAIACESAVELPAGVALATRVRERLPAPAWATAWEACRQLVDYQDGRYAEEYLGQLERVAAVDASAGGTARGHELTRLAARHLALWMSYQDAIRVASQKTRAARYAEIRREVHAGADELVYPVEFMHPRLEEICDVMPRALGAWILGSPRLAEWLRRFFRQGRHLHTYRLGGFLQLSLLAALRPLRRHTLRFALERTRIEQWLARVLAAAPHSYDLALELARCQRLLKGYGDTQARGWRSFSRIMHFVADAPLAEATAAAVARLRTAALADEEGKALDAALAELRASSQIHTPHRGAAS